MTSRLPTREEVAAARLASYESIKAIIDGRGQPEDGDTGDTTEESDGDDEFENGDRARLEALLIKSCSLP